MEIVLTDKAKALLEKRSAISAVTAQAPRAPSTINQADARLEGAAKAAYEFHYGEMVERTTAAPWAKLPDEFKEHWRQVVLVAGSHFNTSDPRDVVVSLTDSRLALKYLGQKLTLTLKGTAIPPTA